MIQYTVSDGVCVLRLNAPPLNTITFLLLGELQAALGRASVDPDVRGIVITGHANHFSAGADVGLFRDMVCAEEAVRTSRVFQEAFQAVEDSSKPVVAAVAGRVMGSALELAMACHFRVGAASARFGMPEVTLGINPGAGGTQRLPRLVGADEALRMLLTGE
jgi:enoyl-CoA hydratase/carnithine racemase